MAEQEQKAKSGFEMQRNMRPAGVFLASLGIVDSIGPCELKCKELEKCQSFGFSKKTRACYVYSHSDLVPDADFDSGIRLLTNQPR
jgi:hypothetical protein